MNRSKTVNEQNIVPFTRQGFFAFYFDLGTGYNEIKRTFLEREKCGIIEIPYSYMKNPWFAIQKRSHLKEIIKVKYAQMHLNHVEKFHRR